EGVDVFDSIWNKVYDTDNANQKEKFESDLKKEIKKLQRYRDQIKTWIQSSEIKDKKALMDARKLIEKEMERFKICEKETKTKAFSKEGLGQQPKTDPKEKAKSETRDWLNNTVSELESQIDSFEAEMEGLSVKKGKTRPPRLTHLESSITRHKAHIMKLELVLRLLDNDELSPEQVNDIKDFLDDYVERNQEDFDEFEDVDMLYSTLPLDKVESLEDLVTSGPPGLVKTPINNGLSACHEGVGATGAGLSIKSTLSTSSVQSPATATSSVQQGDTVQEQVNDAGPKNASISSTSPTSAGTHAISVGSSSVKEILDNSTSSVSSPSINSAPMGEEIGRKPSPALPEAGLKNIGRTGVTSIPSISIPVASGGTVSSSGSLGVSSETPRRAMLGADERLSGSGTVSPLVSSISSRMILPPGGKTSDAVTSGDNGSNVEAGGVTSRLFTASGVPGIQWRPGSPFQSQHEGVQQGQGTLLGMPSLTGGNLKQFTTQQNPLLKQRHPAVTPQSYPQVQAPIVSNPAFWERHGSDGAGTDTLFFAFYYQQNTYQQYLAAKELKKQSWRYHIKFNTWFQRHEEPKIATDDYEQGTYVYFDFHMGNEEMQQGWCQRIKNDFKFEYSFLEDELVV
ncbi:hypothetical protein M8C21_033012, partial [Ambrosia artemisiifolia]